MRLCLRRLNNEQQAQTITPAWEQGRLLIWENEADAEGDAGAKALCSVERC